MVGSSKILTVSYGTFSCTLEGFDESFDTMKAIAEYFRDLAGDDRYFGAEPPTPDAEMLARIAEGEIARRVEARMDSSGIVLRAAGAIDSDAVAPPVMPPVAQAPKDVAPMAAPVAEDTAHIETQPEATASDPGDVTGPEAEDDHVDPSSLLVASGPATAPEVSADPDPAEQIVDTAFMESGVEDEPAQEASGFMPAPQSEPAAHPDSDSVAAKLQRIRAVVGTSTAAAATESFTEDLSATDNSEEFFAEPDEEIAEVEDAIAEDTSDTDLTALLAGADGDLDEDTAEAPEAVAEVAPVEDITEEVEVEETDAFFADASIDDDDTSFDDDIEEATEEAVADATDADDIPAGLSPFRARVLRMKRDDFDAAVEDGIFQDLDAEDDAEVQEEAQVEVAETPAPAAPNMAELDGIDDLEGLGGATGEALSDEDEAELLAELADLQRSAEQLAEPTPVPETVVEETAEVEADEEPTPVDTSRDRAFLDAEPDADEAAMSRILSETDAKMNEPEGNRRRAAIAQLKAAVVATEAARELGDEQDDEGEVENAFRDDLSQVVRPRRAPATPTRPERRTERPRPAPLKLVASQRVDLPEETSETPEKVMPVRPRRVAASTATVAPQSASVGSFAEFANQMGASNLSELLEAAAAFTSFVEGMDDFSRPQIMNKVRDVSDEDFSREDGLRSFGKLLREGRINKVRNGRFQISDDTRYSPERRAAQG